ncbi:NUDIX domain-containing protein [Halosegnis marinus]|uniref:NUDIX domain-containing protein n=1 Tax=Halosegnis marinus TaxID=3034023 RepID=A0ABD5ZQH7_9EURY|nr:NUDIX domain-containing protein [Halosegnis sp. DT85]
MTDDDDERPEGDAGDALGGEFNLVEGEPDWLDEDFDPDEVEVETDEAAGTVAVTVDGERTEFDADDLPFDPPWKYQDEEFSPRMQARLGASRELNRLRERFGTYQLAEERTIRPPELYEGGLEIVEEYGKLADAGAIVRNDEGQVLLVRHPEVEGWGHPSGMYEGEDSLVETARREVRAATGLDADVTGFCFVREKHIVREVERDVEPGDLLPPSFPMVTVIFTAEASGDIEVPEDAPVTDARWFDEPPEDTEEFTAALANQC